MSCRCEFSGREREGERNMVCCHRELSIKLSWKQLSSFYRIWQPGLALELFECDSLYRFSICFHLHSQMKPPSFYGGRSLSRRFISGLRSSRRQTEARRCELDPQTIIAFRFVLFMRASYLLATSRQQRRWRWKGERGRLHPSVSFFKESCLDLKPGETVGSFIWSFNSSPGTAESNGRRPSEPPSAYLLSAAPWA